MFYCPFSSLTLQFLNQWKSIEKEHQTKRLLGLNRRKTSCLFFPIPQIQKFSSYTFDREAELWLGTTAPSWSILLCDSTEPFSFSRAFSFFFFFSSSISVKFSASARLSTAMAKNTLRRMSDGSQGNISVVQCQKQEEDGKVCLNGSRLLTVPYFPVCFPIFSAKLPN